MKKIYKCLVIIAIFFFILTSFCFAKTDFNKQIKAEDGSMFEKIIAGMIGGIAQTVFDFATSDTAGVGFKDYDELIFNSNIENESISPFTTGIWNKVMQWYKIFAIVSESLILIATVLLAYKIMTAGNSTIKKNEVKDSLMRLLLGGIFIAFAPLFIKFLLYLNNSLVKILVLSTNSSLGDLLGESMISSIKTGNAITTAIVISMFIYLFVKLNIKFIIRQFTLIIFTIFTPISVGLWIINKNTTAISIWSGQIIINIFMQFIYCFLFLIYLTFLPSSGGWVISLIWAMMILPLADALQNSLHNLTSRIAGLDNEQMTGRALGVGTALGYSLGTIKEQFKVKSNEKSAEGNGFISRVKSIVNPQISLADELDNNINPIKNVVNDKDRIQNYTHKISNSKIGKIASAGVKATGAYLNLGAKMVEGNFDNSKTKYNKIKSTKRNNQNSTYINIQRNSEKITNVGEKDEFNE